MTAAGPQKKKKTTEDKLRPNQSLGRYEAAIKRADTEL